ncbi:FtsJ-domain-containing protein [Westerdykella ornata]|uniref:rRNA methyltransferase 2, mitochondrial n=1 Tax=Westerdykella ornata TaxID=318751 RepID=A0A6A6J5E5_WESOR|nr:FtsJ-domain-containing protein [Westerdykella ornata]KAF2271363.1 FtsJ-domain-containing protein [Westerdykella ornata]
MSPTPPSLLMLSGRAVKQLGDCVSRRLASRSVPGVIPAFKLVAVGIDGYSKPLGIRYGSLQTRWRTRQNEDRFAREARVQKLKSRAAFKILEINEKYKIFQKNQTVVDLGFAPGSWSQVAAKKAGPNGRVIGIDLIPAQPPRGVSTIQGNFLSPDIQAEVKAYLQQPDLGRPRSQVSVPHEKEGFTEDELEELERGYIDLERHMHLEGAEEGKEEDKSTSEKKEGAKERDRRRGRVVDVVLSDMCEPWEQTSGFNKRSLSDPYSRLANTSGIAFKDHADSMDLCNAALMFAFDTLRTNGHFVCKFYQGPEDNVLETRLRRMFGMVHRYKPAASRSESKEAYFVALRRKEKPTKEMVWQE